MILLFFPVYIIIVLVKEFTLQKFFYITPYLIIYTPLETPGSSPTGCFSFVFAFLPAYSNSSIS